MILWTFLIYILYNITHKEEIALTDYDLQHGIQRRVPWAYAFLVFGYFIFWASMRHYVADTTAYVAAFNNYSTSFSEEFSKLNWDPWSSEGKGVLFNAYSIFFKCFISDNYTLWLSSIAIFSGVCVMITLRKYCMNADFFLASFAALRFALSSSICLFTHHCWAMDRMLFVSQYSTRPEAKMKNITLKTSGMISIILACVGSAGFGLSFTWMNIVAIMMSGRMNQGSGAARSLIHRIQPEPRSSTEARSTQYRARNTGI